ncbi:MAG: Holliday junction branch migration protein RuvA [Oscillospiraceae bacterium]|nr:Holliday junction branch migration protein RuvA [Oscillospiraceae bacterium]
MFYSLTGEVVFKDAQTVALSCGGVAFKCFATRNTLARVNEGESITLYTHLNVREDALDLFGFYGKDELEAFKLLTSVSGVGPKAGLAILSELTPDEFALAVASGDSKAISRANGVGAKIAQRIIMELKDKISGVSFVSEENSVVSNAVKANNAMSNTKEAIEALVALGYSQSEASVAVSKLSPDLSTDDLIRNALKNMTLRF